ncbi:gamma-glutamyltransferase, partial [Rhizobiaceae sp. 2RAB30]
MSAPEPEAVDVAVEILKAGGNAVDAAVACALVQGVVDPPMSGIGGWGTMQVFAPAYDAHVCLDFYATAPAAARSDMWLSKLVGEARDGWGFLVENHENEVGYRAIATPGTLAGLDAAHRHFGRMAWHDLVQPAIDIARSGFPVRPNLFDFLVDEGTQGRAAPRDKMRFSETGRALYYRPDGSALPIGAMVHNPDLAGTLDRIARKGVEDFYLGELARQMAADIGRNDGLLTLADLASYKVVTRSPAIGSYRGHRIATNTPPGGGYALLLMLAILEEFDLASQRHNTPEYLRLLAEVMKHATGEKD